MRKILVIINLLILTIFCVISVFAQNEKKRTYAILLDNSGSLRSQLDHVITIGEAIAQKINSDDSVSLFGFESGRTNFGKAKVKIFLDWDQNDKLRRSINDLYVVEGNTVLYDAIFQMAQAVNAKAESEKDKKSEKVVVIVTDGEERASKIKLLELIEYLKESQIKVFVVGLISQLSIEDKFVYSALSSQNRSKNSLTNLAKETGGRIVFPERGETAEHIAWHLLVRK